MAVKLRLTRMGKTKQPMYRVVAIDSHTKRDGEYIELIGTYNPLTSPATIKLDEEIIYMIEKYTPKQRMALMNILKGIQDICQVSA